MTLADTAIMRTAGERSAWVRLWSRAASGGAQDTAAANSLVTDSAAAASAWALGDA